MAALHDDPEKLKRCCCRRRTRSSTRSRRRQVVVGGHDQDGDLRLPREHRLLCAREDPALLRESVHQLMKDRIKALRLEGYPQPLDTEIRGIKNDSQVMYRPPGAHGDLGIKSHEGSMRCGSREAQAVPSAAGTSSSPRFASPARKSGPRPTWSWRATISRSTSCATLRLVRSSSRSIGRTTRGGPTRWTKRLDAKRKMDPDDYDNIWKARPRAQSRAPSLAKQIKAPRALGRIGPVEPRKPPGPQRVPGPGSSVGNATAVWLHQHYGTAHLFVKYIAKEGEGLAYFWDEMEKFRLKHNLRWGTTIYMPHDGAANLQGAELVNRVEVMESLAAAAKVPVTVQAVTRTTDLGMAIEATRPG